MFKKSFLIIILFMSTQVGAQNIDFKSAEYNYEIGLDYYNKKQYQKAINSFNKAIEINPFIVDAYMNRGSSKAALGNKDAAKIDFDKVLEVTNYLAFYIKSAEDKHKAGDWQGALYDYSIVISITPFFTMGHWFMGDCNVKLNNYSEAMINYNKTINLNPNIDSGFASRAFLKYLLKDYRGAIQDYNFAININGKPTNYYMRGLVKIFIQDIDGACLDFSKAGELGYMEAYKAIIDYCN